MQGSYQLSEDLFGIRGLKERPAKKYTVPVKFGKERPLLFFKLIDKGTYYRLDLKVSIGDKILSHLNPISIMFFIEYDKTYFLLSSLMDAGILEWMGKMKNSFIIFKEHFEAFQKSYLGPLKKYYRVVTH